MRYLLSALPVLLLAACAAPVPPTWVRADATAPLDMGRSQAECEFQAAAATSQTGGSMADGVERLGKRRELMTMCMRSKGFALQQRTS